MRDRLEVDTGTVRSLSDNMAIVHSTLNGAEASSSAVAGMVGHARLASTISDFSAKWDDRRHELVEQIDTLKEAATAVADAFESADNELAAAITEGGDQ